jgi:hypothetical protein
MYQPGGSIIVYVSIRVNAMIDPPGWYIRDDWYPWLIHTQSETSTMIDAYTMSDPPGWYIHIAYVSIRCVSQCMYQSAVSIIVYVSIRWINLSVYINQMYYTIIDPPGWYIHYDWFTWLIHTLWLIHLIDACNMTDTPDWYIHYDWHTWLIHTLWLLHTLSCGCINHSGCITHSVCINHSGCFIQCMHQSGVSINSICINQVCQSMYVSWLIHTQSETSTMIDAYTMSDTFTLIDTYTMIDPPGWYIQYDWYTWLSDVSIIVYVSIRCVSHGVCINQEYQL